ncbi:cell division cycle protein 27 homolog isoform X2 [Argiope bruennichi]|uniref:Cell division cycle protein 27 homolog n=1 Tax=Argiope bruennichi TaxID=94029 RepID=A0A8T0E3Z9_ARGBR|nr:cell division cycle protein 27 homolog isoform X2 [Argiope bruennichi]KAF8766503.1 Cell division cycle protein 27 like protein [Argiope bruennichi]
MIIQEPVQAAIWHALNHYAFEDAIFIAERLFAEVDSDDALYLLATCYYRAGKVGAAYSVLKSKGCYSSQCRFLFARCCVDLKKFSEAEFSITGNNIAKNKSLDDIVSEFGDFASFVVQLLGHICSKTSRFSKAAEAYRKSLKLNPFLWSSYESLVNLGEKPDPCKVFNITNVEHLSMCHGTNPLVNLVNKTPVPNNVNYIKETPNICNDIIQDSSQISNKISIVPVSPIPSVYGSHSPLAFVRSTPDVNIEVFSPDNNSWVPFQTFAKNTRRHARNGRNNLFGTQNSRSSASPCFGILSLSTTTNQDHESQVSDKSSLKKTPMTRRSQDMNPPKFQIFSQSGNNNNNNNTSLSQTPQASLAPVSLGNVRRSSRLFSSSNSVKENNKSSTRNRFISTKAPTKKPKTRTTRAPISEPKESELNEINKPEIQSENKLSNSATIMQAALNMQKASAEGLMMLLQEMGKAQLYLSHYYCRKALDILIDLPQHHYETGWVLTTMGKAHFELAEYNEAIALFEQARQLEPHRLQGMEYYSTALWHLQKEVALSTLAQELTEFDITSPQTWCAAGNCFSLQKEHETAIKYLQRAVQVDEDFAYAYTLLGHEYVMTEEMDKAMTCFRNAIRIDPRHYNAWYGVGMIYYKQEKFQLAEVHYEKALKINPQSSVLKCHIGVVLHALKKMDKSLQTLNEAIAMDPKNPLCKFHRASVYFSLDKHEEALSDLEELKQIVPKESLVYFLIGKVHKKLGNTHLTLMNFSWATDLDPRGANNQIKGAIDKQYTNDEEEAAANNEQAGDDRASVSSGVADHESSHDSSVVDAEAEDIRLQAMESDESF